MATNAVEKEKSWLEHDFGLDRRLIKGLVKKGFSYPTLVQSKSIPIILQGKDVLIRARTGSGKTIAFALPMLQKVLSEKSRSDSNQQSTQCVVLVPTKELMKQIENHINSLLYYCKEVITAYALTEDNQKVLQYKLQSKPDIIIATPAKLVQQIQLHNVDVSEVQMLIIDEADLILSFGYTDDIHRITSNMPKIFQGVLLSATLSAELNKFKKVILHQPVILKLEEPKAAGHLLQFYLECTEHDKFLIIYVFIKLGLLQGKGLIFVSDVNKCYRLKLFLQQFFISTAVLNAEVPINSRTHIIEEYNRGVFDYLIATDATVDDGEKDDEKGEMEDGAMEATHDGNGVDDDQEEEAEEGDDDEEEQEREADGEDDINEKDNAIKIPHDKKSKLPVKKQSKKHPIKASNEDEEYGVSRGIDFHGVNFVINFDFPSTASAYTHRIGRTARGMTSGTSLSFVTKYDAGKPTSAESILAAEEHEILKEVQSQQPRLGVVEGDNVFAAISDSSMLSTQPSESFHDDTKLQPSPLLFDMVELETFRYRVEDTLRSVTGVAVREFRAAEIRREILNSEKLKSYFKENPNDLKVLRHDKAILHPIRPKDHLKHVPNYLIPASMRAVVNIKSHRKKRKFRNEFQKGTQEDRILKSKQNDPLFSLDQSLDVKEPGVVGKSTDRGIVEELNSNSVSGRQQWKMKHHKGKFNPKNIKKDQLGVPGSFVKSKRVK